MREANFMSLKEKAALENQLKIKQRQVGIEEIAPKNIDSKVTNQKNNKKIAGPKNEDIFNGDDFINSRGKSKFTKRRSISTFT